MKFPYEGENCCNAFCLFDCFFSMTPVLHSFGQRDPFLFPPFDLEVDWQSLVNGVGGHELLEWQGKAIGSFKTDATQHQHVFPKCWG